MKRLFKKTICLVTVALILSGCGNKTTGEITKKESKDKTPNDTLKINSDFYDMVKKDQWTFEKALHFNFFYTMPH